MASRTRKVLLGCGGGCLGLLALSIGACVSFTIWVQQPGELLTPTRVLGADTTGYVEWALRAEDPGTEAFVESVLALAERAEAENAQRGPSWMTGLLNGRRRQNRAEGIRTLLPTVAAWTVCPGTVPDRDMHLFTLSIKSIGNRARFMDVMMRFTLGLKFSSKYGDERIYAVEDHAFFVRDNSFFITNSEENARLVVDRLRGQVWEPDRDPSELEIQVSAFPEGQPLRGVIDNSRGELWRVFSTLAELESGTEPPELWRAIEGATLNGGFTGQTAFTATIDFRGPDAEWARVNADEFLTRLRSDYGRGHLPVELDSEALGDSIRVSIRIDDLMAFLDEL